MLILLIIDEIRGVDLRVPREYNKKTRLRMILFLLQFALFGVSFLYQLMLAEVAQ